MGGRKRDMIKGAGERERETEGREGESIGREG